jgi:hypothetical protein
MTTTETDTAFRWYWCNLIQAVELVTGELVMGKTDGLAKFMAETGRLPRLGDEKAPWNYRGWLLPAVMDLLPCAGLSRVGSGEIYHPGRWGYWLAVMKSGDLPLRDPIPPSIDFGRAGDAGCKNLKKCADIAGYSLGYSSAVEGVMDWLSWAFATADEAPRFDDGVNEQLYRTFCVDHWQARPADYLGWLMCESKGNWKDPTAFFPTPEDLVAAMTQMTMGERVPETVRKSVLDPAVGTGRMLLEASNWSVCLHGVDINRRCIQATRINGAVFAPWLTWPFGYGADFRRSPNLVVGDSLGGAWPPISPFCIPFSNVLNDYGSGPVVFDGEGQGLLFGINT